MQNGFIYKITNTLNSKAYIGKTERPVQERFWEHNKRKRKGSPINSAIRKYGKDMFTYEVIAEAPITSLNSLEEFYILQYKTLQPLGYNLTTGGQGGKHTEETKRILSEKNSGANHAMYGKKPWNHGKKATETAKHNQSRAQAGKKHPLHVVEKRTASLTASWADPNVWAARTGLGVYFDSHFKDKSRPWRARPMIAPKTRKHIGNFSTREEAEQAVLQYRSKAS